MGASGNIDCIIILPQHFQVQLFSDRGLRDDLYPQPSHLLNRLTDYFPGKTVRGDSDIEHPSGDGEGFIDGYSVSQSCKIVSGRKSRRASSNDRDLFIPLSENCCLLGGGNFVVGRGSFQ